MRHENASGIKFCTCILLQSSPDAESNWTGYRLFLSSQILYEMAPTLMKVHSIMKIFFSFSFFSSYYQLEHEVEKNSIKGNDDSRCLWALEDFFLIYSPKQVNRIKFKKNTANHSHVISKNFFSRRLSLEFRKSQRNISRIHTTIFGFHPFSFTSYARILGGY